MDQIIYAKALILSRSSYSRFSSSFFIALFNSFHSKALEGVTVQMTRTVVAELDLITEVIERDGTVAAQQIARSLGMSMSIVSRD